MDTLKEILKKQMEINKKVSWKWEELEENNVSLAMRQELTKEYTLALMMECAELLEKINWKFWKKTQKDIAIKRICEEIIDIGHFWFSLCLIWWMDDKKIKRMYLQKAAENIKRQERGY